MINKISSVGLHHKQFRDRYSVFLKDDEDMIQVSEIQYQNSNRNSKFNYKIDIPINILNYENENSCFN